MAPVTRFREPAPALRTYHRRVDVARFRDRVATTAREVRTGAEAVEAFDGQGFWAVVVTFAGAVAAVRFADVRRPAGADTSPGWSDLKGPWRTSLDAEAYRAAVVE